MKGYKCKLTIFISILIGCIFVSHKIFIIQFIVCFYLFFYCRVLFSFVIWSISIFGLLNEYCYNGKQRLSKQFFLFYKNPLTK